MKIVYLNPLGQLGGAEKALLDLMAGSKAAVPDFSPHLIIGSPGPLEAKTAALNIPVSVVPYPKEVARLGDSASGRRTGDQLYKLGLLLRLARASISILVYIWRLRRLLADDCSSHYSYEWLQNAFTGVMGASQEYSSHLACS